jgi:TRAP-type C4-dicarboxylate transport system substrate-binding protein
MTLQIDLKKGVAAAAVTMALSLPQIAAAAEEWDLPLAWPLGNFHVTNAQTFADEVKAATGGEVVITVQPGGILGYKGPEMLGVVRDGLVPIGDVLLNQQVGEEAFLGIESVPYLASGFTEVRALQTFSRPIYEEIARKHNQKILYIVPWPGQNVYSKTEVKTIADLKGLKIRTVDKNGTEFFGKLGASPTQLPWGEVVPSLASGAINGVTTSSSSGVDGKFWEFLKYVNQFHWQSASNMVNVNLDAWNKLSPEHQSTIENLASKLEARFWEAAIDEDKAKLAVLAENGVQISTPDPALKGDLVAVAERMWGEFIADVPEAGPVIAAYRKMVGK